MKNRYFFYNNTHSYPPFSLDERFEYFYFTPSLFIRKRHKGIYRHSNLLYFVWYLLTLGKYKIFYIVDKETKEIAHFSNIMPKIFKYTFMGKYDLQILHCYTFEKYRGMRLYPSALSEIQGSYNKRDIWIGSHVTNEASIKVIERSGFKRVCNVQKRTVFGIYRKIDE
jgi:hypothetical protein